MAVKTVEACWSAADIIAGTGVRMEGGRVAIIIQAGMTTGDNMDVFTFLSGCHFMPGVMNAAQMAIFLARHNFKRV